MKKIIALALLLVLTTGIFVACNSVAPTEKKVRWEKDETWVYNISLCDFDSSMSTANGTYFKDFTYSGEPNPLDGQIDRIAPASIRGTYEVRLTTAPATESAPETATVTTTQTMYTTYEKDVIDTSILEKYVVTELTTDTHYTLKSATTTEVVFKNVVAQTPVSSSTTASGFYVGKQYQGASDYSVQTTYKVSSNGKSIVATTTRDGKQTTTEISNTNVIDNNQVLTYVRSFDKADASFQDSPSVMVFDPLTQSTKKLSFVYNKSQNFLLEHKFEGAEETETIATTVNRLDVLMDGMAYVTQVNLPNLLDSKLDRISTDVADEYIPKHTIVRFRVGFVSYHLTDYVTDDIVSAIRETAE